MSMYTFMSGLQLACIYAILAIGVSIIWSSLGMLNLAHGFTFAAAGYGALMASNATDGNVFALFIGGMGTGAVVGMIICLFAFIRLHDRPNFQVRSLIATLAINMIGVQLLMLFFGPRMRPLPRIFGTQPVDVFGVVMTPDKLGTLVCSVLLIGAVLFWLRGSRRGLEISAMMQNPEGAALVGISVRKTAVIVMAITGVMAGLAAILLSQVIFIQPYSGLQPLIKGLIVALLGGLGSIGGAVAGAILIGFVEAITIDKLGSQYSLMVQFSLIIAILMFRPRGLGGLLDEAREE